MTVAEITRTATTTAQIRLSRRSPHYWRVTLHHPPLNIFGPDTIPQLDEVITAIEIDKDLSVVVFERAVEGFFMTHLDFLAKIEGTIRYPPGPTGLQPLPDMLVRLSRAPVVSIASIRGRATGVGSELALGGRRWVTTAGDYRVFFGWRSDPFFFDANGLFNNMQFTGDDFF